MPTVTDIKEYPSTSTKSPVTIKGQAGKKIKIEEVSLQLAAGKEGITNSTTVSVNGVPYAAWIYPSVKYSDVLKYNKLSRETDEGKDAVITWSIETDNSKYPAKMKTASYTYEYVDVNGTPDTPHGEKEEFIIVKCKESETADLITKIKGIDSTVEINTLSQV
jgi:hypothetical protein